MIIKNKYICFFIMFSILIILFFILWLKNIDYFRNTIKIFSNEYNISYDNIIIKKGIISTEIFLEQVETKILPFDDVNLSIDKIIFYKNLFSSDITLKIGQEISINVINNSNSTNILQEILSIPSDEFSIVCNNYFDEKSDDSLQIKINHGAVNIIDFNKLFFKCDFFGKNIDLAFNIKINHPSNKGQDIYRDQLFDIKLDSEDITINIINNIVMHNIQKRGVSKYHIHLPNNLFSILYKDYDTLIKIFFYGDIDLNPINMDLSSITIQINISGIKKLYNLKLNKLADVADQEINDHMLYVIQFLDQYETEEDNYNLKLHMIDNNFYLNENIIDKELQKNIMRLYKIPKYIADNLNI